MVDGAKDRTLAFCGATSGVFPLSLLKSPSFEMVWLPVVVGRVLDAVTGLPRIHNRAWVILSAPSQVRPLDGIRRLLDTRMVSLNSD
jgi:hypothetical protein